jgi:hypothetical protein
MDKFENIYKIQKQFTEKFFQVKHNIDDIPKTLQDPKASVRWNKEYILAIIKEASELLDELNWKMHVNKDEEDIKDNFLEEGIDVLKYLLGILIINGFTSQEIYQKFLDKSNVVDAKLNQDLIINNIKNKKEEKIAFVDLDGVLATWPIDYMQFVNKQLSTHYKNLQILENEVPKKTQYDLKREYRLSGIKRTMGVVSDSQKLLSSLKELGFFIVLITARPYKKIFRIYSDTLAWLKENNLIYDAIIWEEEKEKYIINNFYDNEIKFVYDDDVDNCNILVQNGFTVFHKFNEHSYEKPFDEIIKKLDSRVVVFRDHKEFLDLLKKMKQG